MTKAHVLKAKALAWWKCSCGEQWRNDYLKGKTDAQLADEVAAEFGKHAVSARSAGD